MRKTIAAFSMLIVMNGVSIASAVSTVVHKFDIPVTAVVYINGTTPTLINAPGARVNLSLNDPVTNQTIGSLIGTADNNGVAHVSADLPIGVNVVVIGGKATWTDPTTNQRMQGQRSNVITPLAQPPTQTINRFPMVVF